MCVQDVPEDVSVGYRVEFVWKSTSFDRMKQALQTFEKDKAAISSFLHKTILGTCARGPRLVLVPCFSTLL